MHYSTFSLEYSLLEIGYSRIAGVDEVGRGCLAGPVVAGIVVISSPTSYIPGIVDSKLMSRKSREKVFDSICCIVDGYGIGVVSAQEIDAVGISEASSMAMARAYDKLRVRPDLVIVDGKNIKSPVWKRLRIDKADMKHYVVSLASVLAKVYRDRLMAEYSLKYPRYGFEKHVGYGTKAHMEAMSRYGICELHRKSYAPVRRTVEGV